MKFNRAMKDYGLCWKRVGNQILFVAIDVDMICLLLDLCSCFPCQQLSMAQVKSGF